MKLCREHMLLYAVTDRAWTGTLTLAQQVALALSGGVTCVQLREKALDQAAFLEEARQIQALCARYDVPFIVNDDVDIAIACGADGVHVGQSDMAAACARARIGRDMILGVSVSTVDQALQAVDAGADYLGVGAVFATATKPDACPVSRQTLRAICRAVPVPVVAIGGITLGNIMALGGTGVNGVALVSEIFAATDIEQTCRLLKVQAQRMVAL